MQLTASQIGAGILAALQRAAQDSDNYGTDVGYTDVFVQHPNVNEPFGIVSVTYDTDSGVIILGTE